MEPLVGGDTHHRFSLASGVVDPSSDQIFVRDPCGNVIELHHLGTCSCNKTAPGSQPSRANQNQEDLR